MSILSILNEISANSSRLSKEAVLKREVNNKTLQTVFLKAYDPYLNFWIKKIPEYSSAPNGTTLAAAIKALSKLANRTYTGAAGIKYLSDILSSLPEDDAVVVERIISRDLRVGCSDSTANKVWPMLIPSFDVMLAHKDTSGIVYPAYAQTKFDGGRCHAHFDGSSVVTYSRSGRVIDLCGALDESARRLMKEGEVWDGEIVFRDKTGNLLDRKTSNGLFNKGVKNTLKPNEAKYATLIAWDIVDFGSTIPYDKRVKEYVSRWNSLTENQKNNSQIWVADAVTVNTEAEAMEFYDKCIKDGNEGAVLKNIKSVWQPKRTKDLGKLKATEEADLRIVSYVIGTGKYCNMMGAVIAETEDGRLRASIGSGFSDEQRKMLPIDVLDKIITVKYNQIITKKNGGKASLFLPRAVEIREDKNVANLMSELK